jgi:HJR/Mrr/RecB family endonuclease
VRSLPRTLDEAVNFLIARLSTEDKATVRSTPEGDLIRFHLGWGMGIRNGLKLWGENKALLKSCESVASAHKSYGNQAIILSGSSIHPDTASGIIIHSVWHALQSMEELYEKKNFAETCTIIAPDFKEISAELIVYFSKNPERMYDLDPRKFEELLEAVFRNQGYRAVLGPGWADGGIDLRLFWKDAVGEVCTLVQAKRYDPKRAIRLEAVAALDALVSAEGANRGLFVTTARYLPSAVEFAAKRGHRLTLATAQDVARWCAEATKRLRR